MTSRSRIAVSAVALVLAAACGGSTESSSNAPGAKGAASAPGETFSLTVTVDGVAAAVRSEPAGLSCPGQCTATFAAGTRVRLVAEPPAGMHLDEWRGACDGAALACELVVDKELSVEARYAAHDAKWDPSVGEADCREAWGTAGELLNPCDKTPDDYVVVQKGKRNLALCTQGRIVRNFRTGLGFTPDGDKVRQGDGRTPEGTFYIPRLLPDSDYHRAFLIGYPTREDAARGVATGIVSRSEADAIMQAVATCAEPSQSTDLGGAVEIHGQGQKAGQDGTGDWTAGCVSLNNDQIDVLWGKLEVSDTIVIKP